MSRATIYNDIFHGAETLIGDARGNLSNKAYDGRVGAEGTFVLLFHIGSKHTDVRTGATNFPACSSLALTRTVNKFRYLCRS